MSENRFPCGAAPSANGCGREGPRETACIETNRILDSCRDRDCYENARVYLTDMGQELIENTGQVRVKECCIAWTYIGIDPVQFNRGFYAITIRFFVKLICEACVRGGRGQEFDGIAVLEKQVVLFGGDSNVSVFRSSGDSTAFCAEPEPCYKERTVPTAVVEVVDPIVLGCRVMEPCDCACIPEGRPGDIPESIAACLSGAVCGDHCSPISDTTIMASAGAHCYHLNHVFTQIPYALTVSGVTFVSFILAGIIQNVVICLIIACALMVATLLVIKAIMAKKHQGIFAEMAEANKVLASQK